MLRSKPNEAKIYSKILIYLVLIVGVVISIFPFYMMFVSATHSSGEILKFPPQLNIGKKLIKNYLTIQSDINFWRVLMNSLLISTLYTILTVFLCSITGFAFAKYDFKGKNIFFSILLATMMIPNQALLIPLFNMMSKLGWIDTYQAIILPTLANVFGIFLMRQNMISFPNALIDAARIDGLGEFGIFFKVVLPNMKPSLGALAIYMFMSQWNNFMWPLIALRSNDMFTFPVALAQLNGFSRIDYGEIMFGASASAIPIIIVFLIFQRQFISGILGGAVKE
ncbi:carbohydrate ABC transporter permease [Thermoanaerobacterium sp. RBIITD]|uniref:carbohydrate ABC transporter permease n=1 Tax=Thermoanaerobacterium sp. RBIITD TaxID=1550240 RepID=UPI000BB88F38|nr:carbohydrate ABC transporter permease [Thermoanaerobacterium sp. RBIITD]SNX52722.1 lactose/L-arabinose transport system permease protein [Thermoanaerobacterium sp. RBIITD]